ncbi:MAG: thiamine phosphate synthase [Acidobacteria bacterium]|nr:thiamine phosphate synthase [Acidobacteriota bacterium]MDA1236225.1 thiamine phosphate synthase [Acidobacteriota bacterium]
MVVPPAFYPILDPLQAAKRGLDTLEVASVLLDAGVRWVQFRHKGQYTRQDYRLAAAVGRLVQGAGAKYVINDRVDIALMVGADGVHVGQDDLPPGEVRKIVGERLFIGYSTHNEAQLRAGDGEPVDYLALGPLFGTKSKENPDPAVGVAELARLRPLSSKPLVAIGGITRKNAAEASKAGADSVAIISDFLADDWRQSIAEWTELEQ